MAILGSEPVCVAGETVVDSAVYSTERRVPTELPGGPPLYAAGGLGLLADVSGLVRGYGWVCMWLDISFGFCMNWYFVV